MTPRLLDLGCGAGGASKGYSKFFEVVGVDIKPQPNYPFEFIQADALALLRENLAGKCWPLKGQWGLDAHRFAAIHASMPCQRWSPKTKHPERHPDLVTPLRELLNETGLPWVMENVPQAPLHDPIILCGSSFDLGVQRHRAFESNFPLLSLPCAHDRQPRRFKVYDHGKWYLSRVVPVYGTGGGKAREHWPEAMGIDWMTDAEMAEALPPAMTEFIGLQLLWAVQTARAAA